MNKTKVESVKLEKTLDFDIWFLSLKVGREEAIPFLFLFSAYKDSSHNNFIQGFGRN